MMRRRILFRCDGGDLPQIGTGHVVRCLALADGLARTNGDEVAFLMLPTGWAGVARQRGHRVLELDAQGSRVEQLIDAARETRAEIVVLDDLGRSAEAVAALQAEGRVVLAIDDPHAPLLADLSINPAFPGLGATSDHLDSAILTGEPRPRRFGQPATGILASFGGFDPEGIAERFLEAWGRADSGVRCTLAVGARHPRLDRLRALAEGIEGARVLVDADLVEVLSTYQLAVLAGGTTLFLAAASGTPALSVAQYAHQVDNAERLAAAGAAISLGLARDVSADELVAEALRLLERPVALDAMSRAGRRALPGLGLRDALQAITVVERLEWDSEFFGREIATLHPRVLTPRVLELALARCAAARTECLYFLGDVTSPSSLALAESAGFRCVDDRLTYGIAAGGLPETAADGRKVRPGKAGDAHTLMEIAAESYGDSRYFHDPGFPRALCRQFYRDWIQKSLAGRFDDAVLVAEEEGRVVGYVSCRELTPNLGLIGLVGIAEEARGRGLGRLLVNEALGWFARRGLPAVQVVTQGRNVAAQGLYEACGFRLERHEKWFHRWFERAELQP